MLKNYINSQKKFVLSSLAPILTLFGLIFAYPIFWAFYISLRDYKLLKRGVSSFVGFANYLEVIKDKVFQASFINTIYFTIFYLFLTLVIGLGLAVYINSIKSKRIQNIIQVIVFLPVVTITVSAAFMWKWMYIPQFGLFNYLLSLLDLGSFRFLNSSNGVIPSIVFMAIWKWVGINVIIFLSGLQSIPEEYYEAARIDGGTPFSIFRRITLPLLKPIFEYVIVTTVLAAMQVFTEIFIMTSGGPGTASRSLAYHIYEVGFKFLKIGEASAVAFLLFAFVLVLTIFQIRVFRREDLY